MNKINIKDQEETLMGGLFIAIAVIILMVEIAKILLVIGLFAYGTYRLKQGVEVEHGSADTNKSGQKNKETLL
jgi:hypothetical protein